MKLNINEIILYFFVPAWAIAEILISAWMLKAKPDRGITSKYPKRIIFLSQLPFGKRWRQHIDKVDIRPLEIYQRRIATWYLSLIIPLFLILYVFTL